MVEEPIAALGGRSFVGCLQDALRAAVEVSRECPPEVVILTGGASRMAFFQQACREAFADALVVLCPEPECSIARRLAYAGRGGRAAEPVPAGGRLHRARRKSSPWR